MAHFIATKRRLVALVVGLLLLIAFFSWQWFIYHAAKLRLEQSVGERLITVAEASYSLLDSLDHDRLLNLQQLEQSQDRAVSEALTAYINRVNVSYFYTLKLEDGTVKFVSSSLTPEERHGLAYKPVFNTPYRNAPLAVLTAFEIGVETSAQYTDDWGDFFSVFVPVQSAAGDTFVIGVDLQLKQLSREAAIGSAISAAPMLLAGLVLVPLFLLWLRATYARTQLELKTALSDAITGLPNRSQLVKDIRRVPEPALVLINIDHFREVSNSYGIGCGDLVLKEYAYFLSCYEAKGLSIVGHYRLQGAEFAILIEHGKRFVDDETAIEDIRRYANWFQYRVKAHAPLALSATLGVAYHDLDPLLLADTALRHAKVNKRDCVVYNRELTAFHMYDDNLRLVNQLRSAMIEQRLVPYFQPVVHIPTRDISWFEVLARVVDSSGNVSMMPNDFVPIAERYRLNQQLAVSIIGHTLAQLKNNQYKVSFNLSIRDIENAHTAERIIGMVQDSGLAHRLAFELLENEAMRNKMAVIKFFIRLRRMGCRVGIDDLGKEYSNFDRLTELPLDFVKIDGAVIQHALVDPATLTILQSFIEATTQYGIVTIAEGIDSAELHAMLQSLNVQFCQGYYYGIPMADFVIQPALSSTPADVL